MSRKIKVSRHGLTRCPACQAHIQIASDLQQTACPFCQTALVATPEGAASGALHGLIRGALATGRSGLLAASLLGLSVGATACGDEEDPPEDTQSADTSGGVDTEPQPAYGIPADTLDPTDTFDPGDAAMYGGPPDSTDTLDQPAYGIPADTLDPEDAPDTISETLYGVPTDTTP